MSNYIIHSAAGTTWEKDGHKWIQRIKKKNGKGWYYIYEEAKKKVDEYKLLENSINPKNLKKRLDNDHQSHETSEKEQEMSRYKLYKNSKDPENLKKRLDNDHQSHETSEKEQEMSGYSDWKMKKAYEDAIKATEKRSQRIGEVTKNFDDVKRRDYPLTEYGIKLKHGKETDEEIQKNINPNYNMFSYGYTHNCAYCTYAYDLNKRGYDVEAKPKSSDYQTHDEDLMKLYKGGKFTYHYQNTNLRSGYYEEYYDDSVNWLWNSLEKEPDNSRGFVTVNWRTGGAHAMAYEITNGEVVIRDCQTNVTYTDKRSFENLVMDSAYMRTDNLEVNERYVNKLVKNRGA